MRTARLMRMTLVVVSTLGAFALTGCETVKPQAPAAEAAISLSQGRLQGVREGEVVAYKGIPYAAPPVGALRWRPPQPAPSWDGVRDARLYGNDCMQNRFIFDTTPSKQPMSEDCLYLNVWAPAEAGRSRPVMVWIHGGGLTIGAGSSPVLDGSAFARKGIVLVTLNYRLGRFGFFTHPALAAEHPGEPIGDYGLMDQIAALQWVKRNIAVFGGDPDNVTIFGQSAGGVSVLHLMTMPSARGLFAKAIVESGGGREHWAQLDRDAPGKTAAMKAGLAFAAYLGIKGTGEDAARALRALPAKEVLGDVSFMKAESATYAGPIIDGKFVPTNTDAAFLAGADAPVPLLVGATDDELGKVPEMLLRGMTAGLVATLGPSGSGLADYYKQCQCRPDDLIDDLGFVEPARFTAREHVKTGAPVWLYRFAYVPQAERKAGRGAVHTAEIPYVFGTLDQALSHVSAPDQRMSETVQDAWIAFARTGDPNGSGISNWPRYAPNGKIMVFSNDGPVAVADPIADRLDHVAQSHAQGTE